MLKFISVETKESYKFLSKWIFISLIAGAIGVFTLQLFIFLTTIIGNFISYSTLPIIVWPFLGALITGGIVYKISIGASGEGMPSYIHGLVKNGGNLSLKVTIWKFFAAILTLSTFGSGGVIGPLGRVSSGLSFALIKVNKKLFKKFSKDDMRVSAICGMAAIVGAVFHSSIGGGVFAVEIIQKRSLHYKDLFPAILASSSAVFFSKILGLKSFFTLSAVNGFMDKRMVGWLLLFSILVGFSGGLFTLTYKLIAKITHRAEGRLLPKVIIGSLVAFSISYFINPNLLGTSQDLFKALSTGDLNGIIGNIQGFAPTTILLLIIIIAKILGNFITVGSGMSAGLTSPSALVGMLLGITAANFLGVEFSSPTYFAFVAAGFSGMLSSSMNIPLAAAILSIEIFGTQYSFPATVSSVIGFQMMRGSTIYDFVYLNREKETKNH